MHEFTVRSASWEHDAAAIMDVRHQVFVVEQKVPASIETDEYDFVSTYVLASATDGTAVGCARLTPSGKVTRIAVLKPWRKKGIAREMLKQILDIAEQNGQRTLYLHAQLSARKLYEDFGFKETGNEFEEAGIQHIKMIRD